MVLLVLFGTIATFIRLALVSLFVSDIVSSFEALIVAFLVLTFVPRPRLLPLKPFESRCFSL